MAYHYQLLLGGLVGDDHGYRVYGPQFRHHGLELGEVVTREYEDALRPVQRRLSKACAPESVRQLVLQPGFRDD